jgi:hypothetical protein
MTSDRARVTYDSSRRYQGVIAQQGRVSLEADWNEAQAITAAQLEARTLDFAGPAGSPDRGFQITPIVDDDDVATGDLKVSPGTLYVGGQRVSIARHVRYGDQPEWIDHERDRLWRDVEIPEHPHELVYLLAREQEVSAVEDPALRDVALGGPDTSQRLCIVQRVIRKPTTARTWEEAWEQLIDEQWASHGFRLDYGSRFLEPIARLQVTCYSADWEDQPADQGGYLGPNNQLVRVQISGVGDDGVPVLVWGYDNASFLYRLCSSVTDTSYATTLRLATPPIDSYHQPREHQAVEVLRSAAFLTRDDYVAASTGRVGKVTKAYNPDSREVVLGTALPPEYQRSRDQGPPLYLRVWEDKFRCEPGEEHELGKTGIRVRLTAPEDCDTPRYPVGAYWMIALRPGISPGSPRLVYPQRILRRPQPPDGPRQWLTPIAFVRWHPRFPYATDLVPRFRSLAGQRLCIRPRDVDGGRSLQEMIDAHASRDHPAVICLEPGTYALPWPLRIGPEHGRLTIRASRPGVVLRAEPWAAPRFLLGLIIAARADGLSLEGLEIHPAHAHFDLDQESYLNQPERARRVLDAHRSRVISIGVHATRCSNLAIEHCRFIFSLPAPDPDAPEHLQGDDLFGAAIFSAEELRGLRVARCRFAAREPLSHACRRAQTGEAADGSQHVALGFVQVPTAMAVPWQTPGQETEPDAPLGSVSVPLLTDAVFDGNSFERLTAPLVAIGQLGALRVEGNTVRDCHTGFWLVTQYASHVLTLLDRLVNQADDAYRDLMTAHLTALAEPVLFHATALARMLPDQLPEDQETAPPSRSLEAPSATDDRHASELLYQLSDPDAPAEPEPAPEQREARLRKFLETFGHADGTREEPEHVAVPSHAAPRCRLSISGNTLESGDAPGLVVLDTAPDSDASLTLTGNQLRGQPLPGAEAHLYRLWSCAAAANVIVNAVPEDEAAASLVVLAQWHRGGQRTAVTGNVLVGRAYLPHRPDGLPSWESLNSVTQ